MNLFSLSLGFFVFLLDFSTKWTANAYLPLIQYQGLEYPYGGIGIFKNFLGIDFSINHQINRGAAWGMLSEYQVPLLYLRIVLIFCLCLYAFFAKKERYWNIPLAMIIAGALGNVFDFYLYGHVVDMFHFVLWGYDFPIFNIADSSIFLGITLMIALSSRQQNYPSKSFKA